VTVTDIGVSRPTMRPPRPRRRRAPSSTYDFQSVLVAAPKQRLVLWLMAGLIVLAAIGLSVAQVDMIVAANGKVVTTDSQIVVQPSKPRWCGRWRSRWARRSRRAMSSQPSTRPSPRPTPRS
jgi:hypothetical protein